jgi:hypothetical protein
MVEGKFRPDLFYRRGVMTEVLIPVRHVARMLDGDPWCLAGLSWPRPSPAPSEGSPMATIPEIEARIHALWAKGEARTFDESMELGRLLTALEAEMPPGDFYTHVLDVLHIPAPAAQRLMAQYRESQEADSSPGPEG